MNFYEFTRDGKKVYFNKSTDVIFLEGTDDDQGSVLTIKGNDGFFWVDHSPEEVLKIIQNGNESSNSCSQFEHSQMQLYRNQLYPNMIG